MRSVLSHDQAIKWAKAKVCVYADSVLCVGQMKDSPGATERWKGQMEGLRLYSFYQDAVGIDGEAIEFEWKIFPGILKRKRVEKRYISMDIQQTQNSCSVIQLSIFGALANWCHKFGLTEEEKGRANFICGQQDVDQVYKRKKYNFWYLLRQWHLETGCKKTFLRFEALSSRI